MKKRTKVTIIVLIMAVMALPKSLYAADSIKVHNLLKDGELVENLVIVGDYNFYINNTNNNFFLSIGIDPAKDIASVDVYSSPDKIKALVSGIVDNNKDKIKAILRFTIKDGVKVKLDNIKKDEPKL